MRAHRVAAGNPEPLAVSFALIAELAEIDGRPIVYEDILEMELEDVLALQNGVLVGGDTTQIFFQTRRRRLPRPTPRTKDPRRAHRVRILLLGANRNGSRGTHLLDGANCRTFRTSGHTSRRRLRQFKNQIG